MTQKFSATCHLFWLYILLLLSSGQNSNCDNCDCLTGDLVDFEAYPVYECEGPNLLYIPNVLLICLYFCQLYLQWPAARLSKWTVKTTQQRQNTKSQFWKLHSAVGPLCSYLQCNVFPRHFLQNCYILFSSPSGDLGIGLVWDNNRTPPHPTAPQLFGPTVEILFKLN